MLYKNTKGDTVSFSVSDGIRIPDEIGHIRYKIHVDNLSTDESFSIKWDWGTFTSETFLEAMRKRFCEEALRIMAFNAYCMRSLAGDVESCSTEDWGKYFICFDFDEIKEQALNFAKIVEPDESKWKELGQVQE